MSEGGNSTAHNVARAMLDAFASVRATSFDVTRTTSAGDKDSFRRGVLLDELIHTLPGMIDAATAEQRNVIVRPHGRNVSFIQLDDLTADRLPRLAPAVFLALETSPGNFQAWLAMRGAEDKDFARRVRKGTGADATASGATRVAIHFAHQGRMTTAAELEQLDLVAPLEDLPPLHVTPARAIPGSNRR